MQDNIISWVRYAKDSNVYLEVQFGSQINTLRILHSKPYFALKPTGGNVSPESPPIFQEMSTSCTRPFTFQPTSCFGEALK